MINQRCYILRYVDSSSLLKFLKGFTVSDDGFSYELTLDPCAAMLFDPVMLYAFRNFFVSVCSWGEDFPFFPYPVSSNDVRIEK